MFPENEHFTLEFAVLDLSRNKRSIIITSGDNINKVEEVYVNDAYVLIPNFYIERRVWLNLIVDLRSLYNNIYKGCTYRSIEGIELSSTSKIRRVMTLSNSQMQILSLIGT